MRRYLTLAFAAAFLLACGEDKPIPEALVGDAHAGGSSPADAQTASFPAGDAATSAPDAAACVNPGCAKSGMWNVARCRCELGCSLSEEVSRRSGGPDAVDCGTLQPNTDLTTRLAAQRCVLDALGAGKAFRLIQSQQGTDSQIAMAYVSSKATEPLSVLYRDSDPSGGSSVGARMTEQRCRSLRVATACDVSSNPLCLECTEVVESSTVCDASLAPVTADCRGAGSYEAGKEGSYRPCCEGLREVFQRSAAQQGDALERVCIEPTGHRQYACVEGYCGDGRCEQGESRACGCPLDCPSAVWQTTSNAQTSCTIDASTRFFSKASQVVYDVTPTDARTLAGQSVAIVRGHLSSVSTASRRGTATMTASPATVFQLIVDRSYKGDLEIGASLYVAVLRAGSVSDADVAAQNLYIPRDDVTVFLATDVPGFEGSGVPSGTTIYGLASPQGLLVSSACGVAQPFFSGSIFAEAVLSSEAVDLAVQGALR